MLTKFVSKVTQTCLFYFKHLLELGSTLEDFALDISWLAPGLR